MKSALRSCLLLLTLAASPLVQAQQPPAWELHPDAIEKADVPRGKVEEMPPWESKIFENTIRKWWVYVPAQYRPETPAAVMVFQDGEGYRNPKGPWRVPVVFDNLIARGDMPPTIAIFINPGHDKVKTRRWKAGRKPGPRIRQPRRSLRPLPPRRDPSGSREEVHADQRPGNAGHLRSQFRRHLFVHRRLGTP